tara:strand:- start:298396 stop:299256 length:861 start_codon:yes stop_codon:yes gene_type:complete
MNKKIRNIRPHLIDEDTHLNVQVYKDRINRQENNRHHSGLNMVNVSTPEESILIRGYATVLEQSLHDIDIQHPLVPLKLTLNKTTGAKNGYLICCGDYAQQCLESIREYIKLGDRIINLGGGLGITATYAGILSKNPVTIIEPNIKMHPTIHKNADLNDISIKLLQACITPENDESLTEFHIMEEPLSSSIFKYAQEVDTSYKVETISLQKLIQESHANVIISDIVGAEINAFENIDLRQIDKVIITINTPIIGEKPTANLITTLSKQGFELKDIKGLVFSFIRTK